MNWRVLARDLCGSCIAAIFKLGKSNPSPNISTQITPSSSFFLSSIMVFSTVLVDIALSIRFSFNFVIFSYKFSNSFALSLVSVLTIKK